MKLSSFSAPVLLLSLCTLTACGGGSKSPTPTPTKDTTPPVITLTGESSITHSAGSSYSDLGATAKDAVDGTVSVTMTGTVDSDVISSYTLTYTATDAAGNASNLTRTVNVVDNIAPVITLEGDSELTHTAGTEFTDAGASAEDAIDGTLEVTTTGAVDSAVVESYTITYTATDAAGNISTATRTVNVVDDVAPVLVLNGVTPFTHNAGDPYDELSVLATDNVDEASDITITIEGEVNADEIASYTITYTATDAAGNASTLSRIVNVEDIAPPKITLNGALEVTLTDSQAYTEQYATAVDNVTDNVVVTITGEVLATPATYTITYTSVDEAENEAVVTRTVIVEEDIVPEDFTFTEKNDVFLNTVIESDPITITGLNVAAAVSIDNGEFSINGGDYTADASSITSGQNIKVRTTSGAALDELKQTSLTIGGITSEFDITTRTAEPSGLFEGTGSVNAAVNNLAAVKGMISNEHFMLFDEDERVLYEGNILTYTGNDFIATIDVYINGVKSQTVTATGSIVNQVSFNLTLTGDTADYGQGNISIVYRDKYEVAATEARLQTPIPFGFLGDANTVNQGHSINFLSEFNDGTFTSGTYSPFKCKYVNNIVEIPDDRVNLFAISFDATLIGITICDHVGDGYKGFTTLVDGGGRGADGLMWFAATNGINSIFSVLTYL